MFQRILTRLAPAALGLLLATEAVAGPVIVTTRPAFVPPAPPVPVVVIPARPQPNYVWIQGQWAWTGYQWAWTPGYWAPQAPVVAYAPVRPARPMYAPQRPMYAPPRPGPGRPVVVRY